MQKLIAALLIYLGLASAALAQQITTPSQNAIACAYNSSLPTLTSGNYGLAQCDSTGHLLITGTITTGGTAQGASSTGVQGSLDMGLVTTSSPTYTTGTVNGLSLDTSGNLRVNVVAGSSGGGTVTQGPAASSGPWIETPWIGGAVVSATNGLYFNLLQGNAVNASGNPIFVQLTSGAAVIGAVTQSGTWNIGSITTLPALVAGSAIIGKVGIDQTTPGTTNGVVINAGTNAIGSVGGFDVVVSNNPTVTNGTYTANYALGGLQTVSLFRNTTQPSGLLSYVQIASKTAYTGTITVYGFTKSPASTCTDNAAFVLSSTDLPYLIPGFPVALTPAALNSTTQTMASNAFVPPTSVKNADSSATTNLYFCAVVTATTSPGGTTNFFFNYGMIQD